jgi:hypothetical protein
MAAGLQRFAGTNRYCLPEKTRKQRLEGISGDPRNYGIARIVKAWCLGCDLQLGEVALAEMIHGSKLKGAARAFVAAG